MTFNQKSAPEKGEKIAVMSTNYGDIKVRLFPEHTPKTVENFTTLAEEGKYDNTIFHRVIKDFMIQGGDYEYKNGTGGKSIWGGKFEDEFHDDLKNIYGALSMANAGPNTNGSQFFIVQASETSWLDGVHSVFGQVFEGMDVVEKIVDVEVDYSDRPEEEVILEKVEIVKHK